MDIRKLGQLIAQRRKQMHYTQEELGKMLGVTGKAVSKWERGLSLPDVTLFKEIAVALKISIGQIFSGESVDAPQGSNALHEEVQAQVIVQSPHYVEWREDADLGFVSPYLFGNNLEHTRACLFRGLSAQMLKNRKFAGKPSRMEGVAEGWFAVGEKTYCAFAGSYTRHDEEHYHIKHYPLSRGLECNAQKVFCVEKGVMGGIGQHGLCVQKQKNYTFAIVTRSVTAVEMTVRLTDAKNERVYAEQSFTIINDDDFHRMQCTLTPNADDDDADIRITFNGQACVIIGSISLMDSDNFRGMRKDVIQAMKEIGITVLRWPGGNFAGEYNWFDGLLPVDERAPLGAYIPLETQPYTLGCDFHEINTDDFIALCREIGAEPFITINPVWNTPEETAAWVEYCNGDERTKYGKMRIERGFVQPYNVLLWSLGNEMGYGHMEGENTAKGYSASVRPHAEKMLEVFPRLTLCLSGPYPNEEWVKDTAKPLEHLASLVSLHYYTREPMYYERDNLTMEYQKSLAGAFEVRNQIRKTRAMLGDGQKISFDEWNIWWNWYRPSCVIDGMHTAFMLHMFIGEARRSQVEIACQYQAVNEGAIQVFPKTVRLTATGKMLKVMRCHCGGKLLYADDFAVATQKENVVNVTLINTSINDKTVFCGKRFGAILEAKAFIANTLLPLSDFDECTIAVKNDGDTFFAELPPISVAHICFSKE